MRVCMIVPHFLPHIGGGEQAFYDIAKGLMEMGHKVRVVCSASGGVVGHQSYDGIDVYYYAWKIFSGHPIVRSIDLIKHVKWADIVHTAVYTTATKTRMLSKKMHKPCVITIHEVLGNKWFWIGVPFYKALVFAVYEWFVCVQKFQGYHFVSDATKRDYEKFYGKRGRSVRIYNCVHVPSMEEILNQPVNLREYFGIGEEQRCFLYYGRPAPNKGVFVLEDAVRILKERGLQKDVMFCCILADDPVQKRKEMERKIKRDNIEHYIKIMPSVERKALFKMVADADYVVVPSITEGFGLCAAEACCLHKKVIHSSGGALPEVVWGECLEFKNRDAFDLADKLQKVIECGSDVFKRIPEKHYEQKEMASRVLSMYKRILKFNSKY